MIKLLVINIKNVKTVKTVILHTNIMYNISFKKIDRLMKLHTLFLGVTAISIVFTSLSAYNRYIDKKLLREEEINKDR